MKDAAKWPAAFLRKVHPRRDRGPAVRWTKPNARKAFRHLAESYRHTRDQWLPSFEKKAPPAVAAHLAAIDRFGGGMPKEIPAAAGVEEEALLFHLAPFPGDPPTERRMIDYWVATRGLRFALEVVATVFSREDLDPRLWDDWGSCRLRSSKPLGLDRLRRMLASTNEETHSGLRQDAAELRRDAEIPLRCALAYLFPAEVAWVEEDLAACLAERRWPPSVFLLAYSLNDGAQLARLCDPRRVLRDDQMTSALAASLLAGPILEAAPSILHALGGEVVEPLAKLLDRLTAALGSDMDKDFSKQLLRLDEAMARIPGDQAMGALVASGREVALKDAAARFPRRALVHLAPRATGGDEAALGLLRSLLAGQPEAAEALASLDDGARRAVEGLLEPEGGAAAPEALPKILRHPPWDRPRRAREPRVVTGLAPFAEPHRMRWAPGQRERFETMEYEPDEQVKHLAQTPSAEVAEEAANVKDGFLFFYSQWLPWLVAHHGLPLLPFVLRFRKEAPGIMARALGSYDSVRVAPVMADFAHRYRNLAGLRARRWLIDHAEAASVALVPAAAGPLGEERDVATAALGLVVQTGHREAVEEAAGRYGGGEVRAALAEILDVDPLSFGVPETLPEMPRFWDPATLPDVRLAAGPSLRTGASTDGLGHEVELPARLHGAADGGGALPRAAVEHLGMLLAISAPDCPDLRLDQVRAACDRRSLAAFARELFETWLREGAEAKEKWAFYALGRFGDDEAAQRIEPLIRQWPRQSAHQKAVIGLEVLAMIGTDFALMQLHGIALAARQKGIQKEAGKAIVRLAADRGLSSDELADRLAPDLGLDADGSRVLDYGPRSFRVGFDETLKPFITSGEGKRLANVPRPGKRDDPEKAKAAYDDWKALKKQLKAVAKQQITRLELAMCHRRRWRPDDFRALVAGHPLLIHLARRLLWGVWDAEDRPGTTFRVDEDRSFAAVDDEPFTLTDSDEVGLVHLLDLDDATASRWREIFGDYELVAPFPQLDREVVLPTEEERSRGSLDRFDGLVVHPGRLLGLSRQGWRRGQPIDDGIVWWMARPLDAGREIRLGFEPGFVVYDPSLAPEQTILSAWLTRTGADPYDNQPAGNFGELAPVQLSEAIRDLEELRRTAS